jgi:hypothetical protein
MGGAEGSNAPASWLGTPLHLQRRCFPAGTGCKAIFDRKPLSGPESSTNATIFCVRIPQEAFFPSGAVDRYPHFQGLGANRLEPRSRRRTGAVPPPFP